VKSLRRAPPAIPLVSMAPHPRLAARAAIVLIVLSAEKFLLNFFVDFPAAQAASGSGAVVRTAHGDRSSVEEEVSAETNQPGSRRDRSRSRLLRASASRRTARGVDQSSR